MNPTEILDNLGSRDTNFGIEIDFTNLLKLPLILFVVGNLLFTILLFLRVRILADTFDAQENKFVKILVLIHIFATVIGSIISILFVMLS